MQNIWSVTWKAGKMSNLSNGYCFNACKNHSFGSWNRSNGKVAIADWKKKVQ